MKTRTERGQALLLLALAFVGLAAFIGLTIDGGILFTDIGHLRRAVDAGALAAAGQFRENRTLAEMTASAKQILDLNNLPTATALVETCDTNPGDPELCPPVTVPATPKRKMVRVTGTLPVQFVFLPIIGWSTIDIHANAVSETASVDVVLAIDTSGSMAFDGPIAYNFDIPTNTLHPTDAEVATCSAAHTCQPFEDVRIAAKALAGRLYYPYDRMALVTFAGDALVQKDLPDCNLADGPSSKLCVLDALNAMAVTVNPPCAGYHPTQPDAPTRTPPAHCGCPPGSSGCSSARRRSGS